MHERGSCWRWQRLRPGLDSRMKSVFRPVIGLNSNLILFSYWLKFIVTILISTQDPATLTAIVHLVPHSAATADFVRIIKMLEEKEFWYQNVLEALEVVIPDQFLLLRFMLLDHQHSINIAEMVVSTVNLGINVLETLDLSATRLIMLYLYRSKLYTII